MTDSTPPEDAGTTNDETVAAKLEAAMTTTTDAAAAPTEDGETQIATVHRISVNKQGFHLGTGRRKSAVARVRLKEGAGQIVVNRKEYKVFFCNEQDRNAVDAPLRVTDMVDKLDIFVNVAGGGPTGQAGAIRMGMARALLSLDQNLEPALRDAGHLTRDSRMKERKKPGQRGARRKFQFSKR